MDPKDIKMFTDLGFFLVGNLLIGAGFFMLVKKKGSRALATLTLILGLTGLQNWGAPDLLEKLINFGVKVFTA